MLHDEIGMSDVKQLTLVDKHKDAQKRGTPHSALKGPKQHG